MANTAPQILLLPLEQEEMFNELYGDFCSDISAQFSSIRKTTVDDAYTYLSGTKPSAVLVVDGGLASKRNTHLHQSLARYAKAGGTVIFACLFSSFVRPADLDSLFKKFQLEWTGGDYHRTTFNLNPAVKPVFGDQIYKKLEKSYSMKCLHLQKTPIVSRVYVPTESSRTASMVFAPEEVDQNQSPAVFYGYGQGFVGYVGDVNNEQGSQALTLAMLGTSLLPSCGVGFILNQR